MSGTERTLRGTASSGGVVVGTAYLLADLAIPAGDPSGGGPGGGGPAEQARAREALRLVAERLAEASVRRAAEGRTDEAEILEANRLMADDPALLAEIDALTLDRSASAAILAATERHAALLAAIPDPYLAARAADIRRLGRLAARLVTSPHPPPRDCPHPPTPAPWRGRGGAGIDAGPLHDAPGMGPGGDAGIRRRGDPAERRGPMLGGCREAPRLVEGSSARLGGAGSPARRDAPLILIGRDLGPAELADLELAGLTVAGIALAEGSETSHAAIIARALGLPLVVGLGEAALDVAAGETVVLDGAAGVLVARPGPETLRQAEAAISRQEARQARRAQDRVGGAVTRDGHPVRLLVNASTVREVRAGLDAGAEGVGLLRTELAFLEASSWPDEARHAVAVRPIPRLLDGRLATIRTLDFGADKTPPFLRGRAERGVALHLTEPDALAAQLRALLREGAATRLRIMLPLVEQPAQVEAARRLLVEAHQEVGAAGPLPPLGAMIETPAAVARIDALAAAADFLSVGTNDLVQYTLGLDRLSPDATIRAAADPRVLQAIRAVTTAAARHGRTVEVCGEAAGDPRLAVLLIGLGVSELSVAPARLDDVRAAVRGCTLTDSAALAEAALASPSADAVLALLASSVRD